MPFFSNPAGRGEGGAGAAWRVTMFKFLKVLPNFTGARFGKPHALILVQKNSASIIPGRGINMKGKSMVRLAGMVLLAGVIFCSGCATPQNPYTLPGTGLGAAVGTAIGAATNAKNPWKGAAIGALLGGSAGYIGGEMYGRANPPQPQQGYYQGGPQQPGYGYAPNQGYNQAPYPAY